jgi:F420-dependent methylenetetrahydromethanopterin dehydrogenase
MSRGKITQRGRCMAARNGVQKLMLEALQDLTKEVKEVRQKDIPNLQTAIEVAKERASTTSKVYGALGGGIAVLISAAMYIWK